MEAQKVPFGGWVVEFICFIRRCGEGLKVTPLQIAHLFATIANGGSRMQPHAVSRVLAYDGKVLKEFAPDPLRQALSKETAAELRQLLADNVTDGTAQ